MDTHLFSIGCNVFKLSSLNFSLLSSAAISWEQAGDLPVDSTLSSAWRGFSVLVCSKGHLFQLKLLSGWPGSSPGFGSFPRRKQRQMFVTWLHFGRKKKSERPLRRNLLIAEKVLVHKRNRCCFPVFRVYFTFHTLWKPFAYSQCLSN